MSNMLKRFGLAATGTLVVALGLQASADTIFRNNTTDLNIRFNTQSSEVGNQIFPDTSIGALAWSITNFSFEYYVTGGSPDVEVKLYSNNGTPVNGYNSPGTVLFDYTVTGLSVTSRSTLGFDTTDFAGHSTDLWTDGGIFVLPAGFTFTVQFSNVGTGNEAGVDIYGPPTVGNEYADYWLNNGSGWSIEVNTNGVDTTIGSQFNATPIPEPGMTALAGLGGLALLAAVRRFRRQ